MKSSDTAEEFEYSLRASAIKDFGSVRSYEPSVSNCYLNGAVCFYVIMAFLKHTFISLTPKRNLLYIHDEKQLYIKYRQYKNSATYRCKNVECKCRIGIAKLNCFRKNPMEKHNHDSNDEQEFELIKRRTLLIISLKNLLAKDREMPNSTIKKTLEEDFGEVKLDDVKNMKKKIAKQKLTGSIITVECVEFDLDQFKNLNISEIKKTN